MGFRLALWLDLGLVLVANEHFGLKDKHIDCGILQHYRMLKKNTEQKLSEGVRAHSKRSL